MLVPLLAVGCGPITLSTSQPSIISFNAEPSNISAGESANISWNVSNATTISIDQGIGSVALTGTRAVAPATTTTYTLTALNSAGTATATTQVIVTGASVAPPSTPMPTPTPTELPTINYFMANPPIISFGGSTTLSYDVSNAPSVTIDNGVGSVASSGTTLVSPAATTNYTLTATNAAGWTSVTVTVVVGAAPAAGMPDLVIEDIVRSGNTINYSIKNQGDATAGPSTSTLRVDGTPVANSNVGSLAPGGSQTLSFVSYPYTCSGVNDGIVVEADTGNTVVESLEVNNSRSETWGCILHVGPLIPAFVKPDLVITDIWIDGHTIRYRIKNEGSGASSVGYSRLYIGGAVKDNDLNVPVIAAGASLPRSFSYDFDCLFPIIQEVKVTADRGDSSNESDETNNSRTENILCP